MSNNNIIIQSSSIPLWNLSFSLFVQDEAANGVPLERADMDESRGFGILNNMLAYYPSFALTFDETEFLDASGLSYENSSIQRNVSAKWIMCEMLNCPGDEFFDPGDSSRFYFESDSTKYEIVTNEDGMSHISNSTLAAPALPLQPEIGTYISYVLVALSVSSSSTNEFIQTTNVKSMIQTVFIKSPYVVWGNSDNERDNAFSIMIMILSFLANIYCLAQLTRYRTHRVLRYESDIKFLYLTAILSIVRIVVLYLSYGHGYMDMCKMCLVLTFVTTFVLLMVILRIWKIYMNEFNPNAQENFTSGGTNNPLFFVLLRGMSNLLRCKRWSHYGYISDTQYWIMVVILWFVCSFIQIIPLVTGSGFIIVTVPVEKDSYEMNLQSAVCRLKASTDIPMLIDTFGLYFLLLYCLRISRASFDEEIKCLRSYKWYLWAIIGLDAIAFFLYEGQIFSHATVAGIYFVNSCLMSCIFSVPLTFTKLHQMENEAKSTLVKECRKASRVFDAAIDKLKSDAPLTHSDIMILRKHAQALQVLGEAPERRRYHSHDRTDIHRRLIPQDLVLRREGRIT